MHALFPIHYYRCHDCNWRGLRFKRGTLRFTLIVSISLVVAALLYEVAGPIIRFAMYLLLS